MLETLPAPATKEFEAEFRNLRDSAGKLLELTPDVPEQARAIVLGIEGAEELTDFLAPNLNLDLAQKQALLEESDLEKRMRSVQASISSQLEIAQIQQKLQQDVQSQFSDAQRRAYLREQVKAIQRELGEADSGAEEQRATLRQKLNEAKPPEEVMKQAERELKRLDFIPQASPDYSVIVTYIETIAELPWTKTSRGQSRPRQRAGNSRPRSLRSRESEAPAHRISRRAQAEPQGKGRSSVFSDHRASARPVSANRSPTRSAGSSRA